MSSSLRDRVLAAVEAGDEAAIDAMAGEDRRVLRHLVGLTYRPEAEIRERAARAIARVGRVRPADVQEAARRLTWAMNDESGTNAVTAPDTLRAIAEERPDLLVALVPDLLRLTADPNLKDRLVEIVRLIARAQPRITVRAMERSLETCAKGGER